MCKGSDRRGGQETRVLGEEGSHVRAGKAGKSQPREGGEAGPWPVCLLLPKFPGGKVRSSLLCSHSF